MGDGTEGQTAGSGDVPGAGGGANLPIIPGMGVNRGKVQDKDIPDLSSAGVETSFFYNEHF